MPDSESMGSGMLASGLPNNTHQLNSLLGMNHQLPLQVCNMKHIHYLEQLTYHYIRRL